MPEQNISKTKRSVQSMGNFSFDEEYLKNTVAILTENTDGTMLTTQKNIATEETLQSIAGMNIPSYDTIEATYPTSSSEVYTYKDGETTVATVTVLYSDSSKKILISVTKE